MKAYFEMDDNGNHRVVVDNQKGDWADYNHIATLKINQSLYISCTAYYEGFMPFEQVLVVSPIVSESRLVNGVRPE